MSELEDIWHSTPAERHEDELCDIHEKYARALEAKDAALLVAKEACEIIAGKRQCLDNLMGNKDVAEAALERIDAALAGKGE